MLATYPHVVVRSRLQDLRTPIKSNGSNNNEGKNTLAQNASISSVVKDILRKEGFKGLYNGIRIDLIRVLPANSMTFVIFEYVKKRLEEAFATKEETI